MLIASVYAICSCSRMRAAKRVLIVTIEHRHSFLHNDRAVIKFFIHKMHSAAGNFHPIGEGLLLRFKSRERGQQRRMNIQNPPRELLHKPRREQPHVSRKADEIHIVLLERRDDFAVVLFSWLALRWNHERIQPALPRRGDARCVRFVGDDNGNSRVRDAARIDAVGDGDKIRAASGEENAKGMHDVSATQL